MLTLLSRILQSLSFDAPVVPCEPDLLDDPVFRAMTPRELADLPLPRPTPREEPAVMSVEPDLRHAA